MINTFNICLLTVCVKFKHTIQILKRNSSLNIYLGRYPKTYELTGAGNGEILLLYPPLIMEEVLLGVGEELYFILKIMQ